MSAVITVATTGPIASKADNPTLPTQPEEIAAAVEKAYRLGASVAHLHFRDEQDRPTADLEIARRTMDLIAERCPIHLQVSTGVGLSVPFEERAKLVELRPRMATLNPCSMSFGTGEFRNAPNDVRRLAARMHELGIKPELEIYDTGHLDACLRLRDAGLLEEPLQFSIVLGVVGGAAATADNLISLVRRLPDGAAWQIIAIGRANLELTAMGLAMGGNARAGMEDTIYLRKGEPTQGNEPLVARAVRLAEALDRTAASVEEAERLLGLGGAMRRIAIEEAFWLDGLDSGLAEPAASPYKAEYRERWATRLIDVTELRLQEMDDHGIDMQVLSLATPGVQAQPNTAVAIDDARRANDALATIIAEHPSRFGGLAALPLQDPAVAARELRRAVNELSLHGALVNDHTLGHYLDEPRFDVVWAELEELGVPLYLHPSTVPNRWAVLEGHPELDGPTYSWNAATPGHALRLMYGGVFDRFPCVKVILGHMGEFLPFWVARLDAAHLRLQVGDELSKLPSQYLADNVAITTSGVNSHSALVAAIQAVGVENVLFAVDYPFESTADAVAFLDRAPLAASDRARIAHGNAERLLRLDA